MNERERFDALLETLDDLAIANNAVPILVEGQRDVAALRALGCEGDLLVLHVGRDLSSLAEGLARETREIILFTDWDRKGAIWHDELSRRLAAVGVRVDGSYRERVRARVSEQLRDVESLLPYVTRGLDRHHRKTLDDHRQGALD